MAISTDIGIWLAAFFIIAVYSWLYKYNDLFRFAEHTLIGAAAGYGLVMGIRNIMQVGVGGVLNGKYHFIIALILGLSLYMRFFNEYAWMQRYGISFVVAAGSVIRFRALIVTSVTQQIASAINKISLASALDGINSIVIIVFSLATMMYFAFSRRFSEDVPGYSYLNLIGRYGVLTLLGYYLGITIMTRLQFVINRLSFLLFDWLGF